MKEAAEDCRLEQIDILGDMEELGTVSQPELNSGEGIGSITL